MVALPDLGTVARGRVVDPETWRPVRPARIVSGNVVVLYGAARNVVKVETPAGERLDVRVPGIRP